VIRLQRELLVERPPSEVFALVSDPGRYPEFFAGITRWEILPGKRRGVGARYRVLVRSGSIEAGGRVRVTEWKKDRTIAWVAEQGIDFGGRWTLTPVADATELQLEIHYDLGGGLPGALVERITGRTTGRNMTATFLAVRRMVEHEQRPAKATRKR
jgi:ribosome-associated toxin RatA of RatAB toxin-antitoxin module